MPAIDERARLELFEAVQHTLGAAHADTLMSLLPPVGWADVATKHDIHELERRLDLRFEAFEHRVEHQFETIEHRFEALEHKLTAHTERTARTLVITMLGAMMTLTSLNIGAVVLAT